LQHSGTETIDLSSLGSWSSIDEIKTLEKQGLDLRRSGHLYLQYVTARFLRRRESNLTSSKRFRRSARNSRIPALTGQRHQTNRLQKDFRWSPTCSK
jgi:hypothetical protein